ncbi:hypothetical protein CTRI78_v009961 [Colletotrichum trifolii]|uniref:Uncharacterized protein n=1 Tax=Colletotrichum trifolii TaxID=5466 RepID=A0A4V3HTT7_COLTR|nr:hypothetical protein CTRI78_v009961 [Colletotrichum trifolii]
MDSTRRASSASSRGRRVLLHPCGRVHGYQCGEPRLPAQPLASTHPFPVAI